MDFTREPIVETIITPRSSHRLLVRNSKGAGLEEYFLDAVEVVSFGHATFYRSLERPKSFLLSCNDYEILEIKETRLILKAANSLTRSLGDKDALPPIRSNKASSSNYSPNYQDATRPSEKPERSSDKPERFKLSIPPREGKERTKEYPENEEDAPKKYTFGTSGKEYSPLPPPLNEPVMEFSSDEPSQEENYCTPSSSHEDSHYVDPSYCKGNVSEIAFKKRRDPVVSSPTDEPVEKEPPQVLSFNFPPKENTVLPKETGENKESVGLNLPALKALEILSRHERRKERRRFRRKRPRPGSIDGMEPRDERDDDDEDDDMPHVPPIRPHHGPRQLPMPERIVPNEPVVAAEPPPPRPRTGLIPPPSTLISETIHQYRNLTIKPMMGPGLFGGGGGEDENEPNDNK